MEIGLSYVKLKSRLIVSSIFFGNIAFLTAQVITNKSIIGERLEESFKLWHEKQLVWIDFLLFIVMR